MQTVVMDSSFRENDRKNTGMTKGRASPPSASGTTPSTVKLVLEVVLEWGF